MYIITLQTHHGVHAVCLFSHSHPLAPHHSPEGHRRVGRWAGQKGMLEWEDCPHQYMGQPCLKPGLYREEGGRALSDGPGFGVTGCHCVKSYMSAGSVSHVYRSKSEVFTSSGSRACRFVELLLQASSSVD